MPSTNSVDHTRISRFVRVPGRDNQLRHRRDAVYYINQGYRVTDDHGVDLTIETRQDGTHRIVRGEDPLGSYNERQRTQTIMRARRTDESGRPLGLPARELTDYEAGQ